ncbi:heterokaryon incompatibility protein [Colletotrichum incanum]|uniref:Heterokaryon incompatibility protein n=1 Tax=Colletotrichum incanum TaxID=1573173 RepID=A0A161Y2D3_COLIC|nr:heterokaryon incompatibility protein [Colletotrichum incanum]
MFSFFLNNVPSTSRPTTGTADSSQPSIAGQGDGRDTFGSPQGNGQISTPSPTPLSQPPPTPSDSVYTPLPPNSIRLLKLHPGHVASPLECDLITVDISQAPIYDALSYVWGLEDSPEPITCNAHQVPVRNNLLLALRHLRPRPPWVSHDTWPESHDLHSSHNAWKGIARNRNEMRPGDGFQQNLVWVDSLCINQANTAEREEQVKLMNRIFARAETVKIWLGPADTAQVAGLPLHTERVPTMENGVLRVSGLFARERPLYQLLQYGTMPLVLAFIAQALRNVKDLVHRNKAYGLLRPSAEEWVTLRRFFANGWFDRVWIVQEIVFARRAVVIVGDWQVEWKALGQAAAWFENHGYSMPANFKFSRTDRRDLMPVAKAAAV